MLKQIAITASLAGLLLASSASASTQPTNILESCVQMQRSAVTQTRIAAAKSAPVEVAYQANLPGWRNTLDSVTLGQLEQKHANWRSALGGVQIALYGVNGDTGLMGITCADVSVENSGSVENLLWNFQNVKNMGPGVKIVQDQLTDFIDSL